MRKPLYGLTDSGRKFWLSFKAWIEKNGYQKMTGDSAFYYKREDGILTGMILLHVDDVIMGGSHKFVNQTTEMIKQRFNISKTNDGSFRFCGLDITLKPDGRITVSMEDYANSLEKMYVDKKRDKDEETTYRENCDLRENIGKLAWLADNVRPDLSY